MRRLLGLFEARQAGLRTRDRLQAAGFTVETVEQPPAAAQRSREATTQRQREDSAGAASGATVGALAGGGIGAVPGALLGVLAGHGLTELNARRYERVVAEGGVVLVVDAPEILPAAQAEDWLRAGGALHVHTGEMPRG